MSSKPRSSALNSPGGATPRASSRGAPRDSARAPRDSARSNFKRDSSRPQELKKRSSAAANSPSRSGGSPRSPSQSSLRKKLARNASQSGDEGESVPLLDELRRTADRDKDDGELLGIQEDGKPRAKAHGKMTPHGHWSKKEKVLTLFEKKILI